MNLHKFDENYFENGVKLGISCYENYHYMPERSLAEANAIKNLFGKPTILDYGCGKAFLVKALRDIGINAFGYDISEYAIKNCHEDASSFVSYKYLTETDLIVCKDVLEHIEEKELNSVLNKFSYYKESFIIVPFGDNDEYRIEEYSKDVTHILAKDEQWWIDKFFMNGLKLVNYEYKIDGIKDKWYNVNKRGNGFFHLIGDNYE